MLHPRNNADTATATATATGGHGDGHGDGAGALPDEAALEVLRDLLAALTAMLTGAKVT